MTSAAAVICMLVDSSARAASTTSGGTALPRIVVMDVTPRGSPLDGLADVRSVRADAGSQQAEDPDRAREREARVVHRETLERGAELATPELLRRFAREAVFWRQLQIARLLDARRDSSIVTAVEPLLSASDRHVRANAAYLIARQGDPRGLAVLVAMLDDHSRRECSQGTPGPCSPAAQLVSDRYYAVHVLGVLRDPHAIPALARLVGDRDVGYAVPWALAEIGTDEAVAPIVRALDDPDPTTKVGAIEALQKLKAHSALPKLRRLVRDDERSRIGQLRRVGDAAREAIDAIEARKPRRAATDADTPPR